tara:strand:- start:85 stop:240 length:156 start_codon:yes stop_codon:yes gene_type:complete
MLPDVSSCGDFAIDTGDHFPRPADRMIVTTTVEFRHAKIKESFRQKHLFEH